MNHHEQGLFFACGTFASFKAAFLNCRNLLTPAFKRYPIVQATVLWHRLLPSHHFPKQRAHWGGTGDHIDIFCILKQFQPKMWGTLEKFLVCGHWAPIFPPRLCQRLALWELQSCRGWSDLSKYISKIHPRNIRNKKCLNQIDPFLYETAIKYYPEHVLWEWGM